MERAVVFQDPLDWFPGSFFTNLFSLVCVGVYVMDYITPRLANPNHQRKSLKSDHGSFLLIIVATTLAIFTSVALRVINFGTLTGVFQWLGLFVILAGAIVRQWALIHLGRFFSRTVQIEASHQIVKTGPYQWIRHPAYTGMILIYPGISMALGTWLGALITCLFVTGSLLYRIQVEEATLTQAFGDEYRQYTEQTWRLFPGW